MKNTLKKLRTGAMVSLAGASFMTSTTAKAEEAVQPTVLGIQRGKAFIGVVEGEGIPSNAVVTTIPATTSTTTETNTVSTPAPAKSTPVAFTGYVEGTVTTNRPIPITEMPASALPKPDPSKGIAKLAPVEGFPEPTPVPITEMPTSALPKPDPSKGPAVTAPSDGLHPVNTPTVTTPTKGLAVTAPSDGIHPVTTQPAITRPVEGEQTVTTVTKPAETPTVSTPATPTTTPATEEVQTSKGESVVEEEKPAITLVSETAEGTTAKGESVTADEKPVGLVPTVAPALAEKAPQKGLAAEQASGQPTYSRVQRAASLPQTGEVASMFSLLGLGLSSLGVVTLSKRRNK